MSKPLMKHRTGSRKERVHQTFAAEGADKALALGRRLKLKEPTLRTWFSAFRRTRVAAPAKAASRARPSKSTVETASA